MEMEMLSQWTVLLLSLHLLSASYCKPITFPNRDMSKQLVLLLSLHLLTRVRCSDLLMSDPSCFEHGVEYHGGGLPDPMVDQVMQMNLFCQPSLRQEKGWVRRDRALKMRIVATCKSKLKPRWALQRPASSCAR